MDRRNFLKGTFGGVAAGGIVIAAGLPDTQAFVEQVKIGDPVAAAVTPADTPFPDVGHTLFDYRGRPVGVISSYNAWVEKVEVTSSHDEFQRYIAGQHHLELTVVCAGPWPTPPDSKGGFRNG